MSVCVCEFVYVCMVNLVLSIPVMFALINKEQKTEKDNKNKPCFT